MAATPQEIFERYVCATTTRDVVALTEMFATDGVYEAPLVRPGGAFPNRVEGREKIREFLTELYQRSPETDQKVNLGESRYVLHTTADPDVFIAEVDTAFDGPGETMTTMSLVYIYRVRDGKIALLRDYFAPEHAA
jgi:ketosteroid isomerase-like protein